jgi:glycosyltransferase involved in cell wall biosynthesis
LSKSGRRAFLDPFQGIDILINAFSHVKKKIKSAYLIIAGSTVKKSHIEYYKNMAEELKIGDDVIFIEPDLREVPALLKIAHVAVVPRVNSMGIPTKLLNYLAARCAVVSFKGAADFLKNSNAVHLVEGDDFYNLAEGIIYLLNNHQRVNELRKNGRNIIERYYSWDVICDKIIEIYERLIYEST